MMKRIFWTGYSNKERNTAIYEIGKIISNYGFVTDSKRFSDLQISMTIEIEELNIDKLYCDLKKYLDLNDFEKLNSNSKNECIIFLNTSFIKGTGDFIIEVPSIPG
jgi:hypothetical protein